MRDMVGRHKVVDRRRQKPDLIDIPLAEALARDPSESRRKRRVR
jgi:hypothetical protein